ITVVLGTELMCYRELLLGISNFGNARGNWHIDVVHPREDIAQFAINTKPDGMLLGGVHRFTDVPLAQAAVRYIVGVCAQFAVQRIREQAKPLALMACNELRGRDIAQLCRDVGLRVPDDVAILGVDNDDLTCALAQPPLSSVVIPWRRLGALAAELLHRMMEGH